MANHKATLKDVRKSAKRNAHNRYYSKTTRNAIKKFNGLTELTARQEALPEVVSMIDKLAKRHIIHKNKAAHLKSQLTKKVNA